MPSSSIGKLVLSGAILNSCVASTFSPSEVIPEIVREQFESAQNQVARQYPDAGDPFSITPEQFLWEEKAGKFKCGETQMIQGCFRAPNRIQYTIGSAGALWHESGHAILYALGDARWKCCFSGHEGYDEC